MRLIKPDMSHQDSVMSYKKEMLDNHDSFDGCAGLEDCDTYEMWLDFDNRLKAKYVMATLRVIPISPLMKMMKLSGLLITARNSHHFC